MQLNAVYLPCPEGDIGYVEGLSGADTQGSTSAETRTNLREAVEMVLEANRLLGGRTDFGDRAE